MKALLINSVCGIRSTGRICTDIANELIEQGYEVKIAYGRENAPEQYKNLAVRIGNEINVKFNALKCRVFDNDGFSAKAQTKKFLKWADNYNPDVLWLHNLHGYYINVEMLFEWIKSRPQMKVKWTLHDCWAFTGHCAHFTSVGCDNWKKGCFNCPQKQGYPSSFFLDASKKNWKRKRDAFTGLKSIVFVTPSEWLASLVRQSFLWDYNVCAIPNGIDLDVFKPTKSDFRKKYGLENKVIILGVATSWSERKGLSEFQELSTLLDNSFKVVLVGLKSKMLSADVAEQILCIPKTDSAEELAAIYTAADIFVNAGKEETMGLTTVEAMACGTPVLVSNLTAVPEVVTADGGIVLKNLTAEDIANGINQVLSESFNPRKNAKQYEKRQQYLKYLNL